VVLEHPKSSLGNVVIQNKECKT